MKIKFLFLAVCFAATTLFSDPLVSARFPMKTVSSLDVTAPTVVSVTVASNGTTVTIGFSENATRGAGYSTGNFDLDGLVTNNTLTYVSGDGTNSWTMTATSTILTTGSGDTPNLDFSGTANSVEDAAGNDLAAIVDGSVTNNSSQTGISFLISENFEGTSSPETGWSDTGTPTWHYTTNPLVGSKSYRINPTTATQGSRFNLPGSYAALDVFMAIRFNATVTANTNILYLTSATFSSPLTLRINNSNANEFQLSSTEGLGANTTGLLTPTMNGTTIYYIWIHWAKGTGATGVGQIWISTTTTKPASSPGTTYATYTTGTDTSDVTKFDIGDLDHAISNDFTIDYLRVSTSTIGSAP